MRGQHPSAEAIKQLTNPSDHEDKNPTVLNVFGDSMSPAANLDLTIEGQQMKVPEKNVPKVVEKTPTEIFQAIPYW